VNYYYILPINYNYSCVVRKEACSRHHRLAKPIKAKTNVKQVYGFKDNGPEDLFYR